MIEVVEFERRFCISLDRTAFEKELRRKMKSLINSQIWQLWIFSNRESIVFEKKIYFSERVMKRFINVIHKQLIFSHLLFRRRMKNEIIHSSPIFSLNRSSIKSLIILINIQQMIFNKYLINQCIYLIFCSWEWKE